MTERPGDAILGGGTRGRRRLPVRLHLLILGLTALLPLWMLAGYTAWRAAEAQRASFATDTRDAARNLAFVLEREMVGLRGALTALGSSPALRSGDYATFHDQAMALQSVDGSRIRLTDAAGRVLVDTSQPYREALPQENVPADPRRRETLLSDTLSGVLAPERPDAPHQVALTLEVPRGPGQEPLFLSIGTDPLRLWLGSLQRAALPPGWVALIADAEGRIIAREPYDASALGRQLPAESAVRQALASGRYFGWSRARARDGRDLYTAWHRVGTSPWLVLVGLPAAMPDGVLFRALAPVLVLGGGLLLLFTLGLTFWADRRIASPLARMGRLAAAYGQGAPLPGLRRSGVREIDAVGEALVDAAASREVLEAERLELAARLRTVLESTTDGVLVLDPDWRLLYLNGRARLQLGGKGDATGRVLPDAYPGWAQGAFAHAYRRAMTERKPQRVTAFHVVLGRWISADAYPSAEGLTIFFRDVSAERAAEVALRENESLLKAVLDNVPVGVMVAEAHSGRVILANRRLEEILRRPPNLSRDAASYGGDWEWYHPDGRKVEVSEAPLARTLSTGMPAVGEFHTRRGDGTLCWVRISASAVRDARGRVTSAVAALMDIDAERRAAEQLRESEQRFRTLAETIPQIVWSAQPDGQVDYVNPRLQDFTGLSASLAQKMLPQIVHPEDQRRAERAWRRALHAGESFSAELRLRRADGGWRWCVARALPVRDAAEGQARGQLRRWIGTVTDVTDMVETREALARQVAAHAASREAAVQAAAALAASESRFRRFAEASPDVMWMTDPSGTTREFVSPAFERIWGLPQEAVMAKPELWLQAVHASDRERVLDAWDAARNGGNFDAEYRILRPDGGQRWIRDTGFPILDAQGAISRRGGLARDITSAKAAEARQMLLLGELNHRVKNTLATVHSLAMQTARTTGVDSEALQRFLSDFQARLMALSRGHDLLTARTWRGATLEDAARAALAPWHAMPDHGEGEERLRLSGPAVWLAPKQALGLALALHELATNAAKHGALSRPDGHIHVAWHEEDDGMVELRWLEEGGPPVQAPKRRGFGTRMLERGLPAELGPGSAVVLNYAEAGFSATIRFRPINGPRVEEERA
ncbi:PAS domain S-box protein [Roseomonas marmotae]|uniref:histidine kinase n=1 Tax=Roseomonas marmotae TaxID=2768161 RepID=A0ABS3KEV5_9PROT|nr:PAS domain S-box protein [Roseomonas marmotae]MBO1076001.1 PAS domain S-box protein [Roseomonas marmotae]QTI80134.1 PAS domain S-box protein [Roseomonas marmotae]